MTFLAFEHGLMNVVTEISLARIGNDKLDLFCCSVAFIARAGGRKGAFAVVTGAAGLTVFHIGHRVPLTVGATNENSAVTITAFVHSQMERVTECGVGSLENNVF